MLRKGSSGQAVKHLQEYLKSLGMYHGPIDGQFGPNTKQAVVAFQTAYLVDGIVDTLTEGALEAAFKAWAQKDQHIITPVPHGFQGIRDTFGIIEYREAAAGAVEITNDWAEENIVTANLPVVGKQMIHRKMEPVFRSVLQNIKDKGLDKVIDQFGVWCPRHKMHNPNRSLSSHSWAIACDINWATNPPGAVGDMDPGIVDSFERHGFQWGGRWKTRDDMHFQYCTDY